jgi:hypothetical protein
MAGAVDAVMILRDDWTSHLPLSSPFLAARTPLFVDKPLTADARELQIMLPYVQSGYLMTCSGLRYAPELAEISARIREGEDVKQIRITVPKDVLRYGIHALDILDQLSLLRPQSVRRAGSSPDSFVIYSGSLPPVELLCMGTQPTGIVLSGRDSQGTFSFPFVSNFESFRETIAAFLVMVETHAPPIDAARVELSLRVMRECYLA